MTFGPSVNILPVCPYGNFWGTRWGEVVPTHESKHPFSCYRDASAGSRARPHPASALVGEGRGGQVLPGEGEKPPIAYFHLRHLHPLAMVLDAGLKVLEALPAVGDGGLLQELTLGGGDGHLVTLSSHVDSCS